VTPYQITQLLAALEKISQHAPQESQPVIALLLVIASIMSLMWRDLKGSIKETRTEWQTALAAHKAENDKDLADHKADNEKDYDLLWEDRRRCQDECCPPRVKKGD